MRQEVRILSPLIQREYLFFRTDLGKPKIFHLDSKSPDVLLLAERFPLQPRDIIFIDRVEGIRWNQIIGQVQPTVNLVRSIQGILN